MKLKHILTLFGQVTIVILFLYLLKKTFNNYTSVKPYQESFKETLLFSDSEDESGDDTDSCASDSEEETFISREGMGTFREGLDDDAKEEREDLIKESKKSAKENSEDVNKAKKEIRKNEDLTEDELRSKAGLIAINKVLKKVGFREEYEKALKA